MKNWMTACVLMICLAAPCLYAGKPGGIPDSSFWVSFTSRADKKGVPTLTFNLIHRFSTEKGAEITEYQDFCGMLTDAEILVSRLRIKLTNDGDWQDHAYSPFLTLQYRSPYVYGKPRREEVLKKRVVSLAMLETLQTTRELAKKVVKIEWTISLKVGEDTFTMVQILTPAAQRLDAYYIDKKGKKSFRRTVLAEGKYGGGLAQNQDFYWWDDKAISREVFEKKLAEYMKKRTQK